MSKRYSKTADRIRYAYHRGYRVSRDGREVQGMRGKLKLRLDRGYPRFNVNHPEHGTGPVKVHQLQAYQIWQEASLEEGIEIRHLNHDRSDSSVENLALGSKRDNYMDQSVHRRKERAEHAADHVRALTDEEVKELRQLRAEGWKYDELAEEFEITKSTVSYIVRRITYQHVE